MPGCRWEALGLRDRLPRAKRATRTEEAAIVGTPDWD